MKRLTGRVRSGAVLLAVTSGLLFGAVPAAAANTSASPASTNGSASPALLEDFYHHSTYPTSEACWDRGIRGDEEGLWGDFICQTFEGSGGWQLWVDYECTVCLSPEAVLQRDFE